ncbi:MAG: acyl transferase [Flavitalea sp.]
MNCELQDKVFAVTATGFESLALEIFRFQYAHNTLYREFTDTLRVDPVKVRSLASIPFLPVGFFKNHEVVTGEFLPEYIFESSGTTNTGNSRHMVRSLDMYRKSFLKAFELFYGPVQEWCIIGLLPSYLERQNSSLVMMVDELIKESHHSQSGFYLYEYAQLAEVIRENEKRQQKTLLLGVTFALIDFAETFKYPLKCTTVMETGGMKGRRKEITRQEVHQILKSSWQLDQIHSEYGMSELLSQAYSKREGLFECSPWMKIILREEDDPVTIKSGTKYPLEGLVNVIDFANMYSCSFIATDDMGKLYSDGSFEIIGRMDSSDVRGCSLMYT